MEQVVDLALPEYFERISAEATFQEQLSVIDMDNSRRSPVQVKNYPIRLKGYSLIFVLSGEITIGINYLSHTLKKNTVMQVYPDDIIEHTAYSADFKGYLIIHSAELKKEIMAMTSGIRLQQAGQLKKLHTRQELNEEESLRLRKQVELIKSYIPDKEHVYHSYVIKNQIINLFFDLDNCRWHRYGDGELGLSRSETLRQRFRELLMEECRIHREVTFYADKLCVTPDYLSKVVREYDGQSAAKWIINAVITETKILLREPDKTISQIAMELNFPDQSTFGKFFKRNTGLSPLEYKKGEYTTNRKIVLDTNE